MTLDRTTPPPISNFAQLDIPTQRISTVADGVRLHLIDTGNSDANWTAVTWNYGSNRMNGLPATGMVAQMLMQGSRNMTGEEIVDRIDFLGAFMNNSIYSTHTSIEVMSLNDFIDQVLDILTDILIHPTFPSDRFEALRRKAIAKFDLMQQHSKYVASKHLDALLAGENHPYAGLITRDDIERTSIDEVRQAWEEGLRHSAIDIFVSGKITSHLEERLKDFAKDLNSVRGCLHTPSPMTPFTPSESGRHFINMPESNQSSIAIGIPTIPRSNPDYTPLRIAVTALGGYFGSRLMTNIREDKGLTYGIMSHLMGAPEGSSIVIYADCDSSYVDTVLQQIDIEMYKMAHEVMQSDEFDRLCSYYMTTLASTLESFRSIGDYYRTQLTLGLRKDYFQHQQNILRTITPEDIRRLASQYFDSSRAITVIAGR